jgi:hypothetical protein
MRLYQSHDVLEYETDENDDTHESPDDCVESDEYEDIEYLESDFEDD